MKGAGFLFSKGRCLSSKKREKGGRARTSKDMAIKKEKYLSLPARGAPSPATREEGPIESDRTTGNQRALKKKGSKAHLQTPLSLHKKRSHHSVGKKSDDPGVTDGLTKKKKTVPSRCERRKVAKTFRQRPAPLQKTPRDRPTKAQILEG